MASRPALPAPDEGSNAPPSTASGRLLLSQLEAENRSRILSADPDYADLGKTSKKALEKKFTQAAKSGYVIAPSGYCAGVNDVSVAIGNVRLGLTATVAVPLLMSKDREADVKGRRGNLDIYHHGIHPVPT